MPSMSAIFSTLLAIAFFFNAASALPLKLVARDAVSPPITKPVAGDVWHIGDTVTVTWDTSVLAGVNVTNPSGTIVLGFLENNSENLMLDTPLAQGFSIFTGSQDITVPNVPPKKDYIVALLGDSGNISPEFQIVANIPTPSPPISRGSSPVLSQTLEPTTLIPPISSPSSTPTIPVTSPTSTTPLSTPSVTPSLTPTPSPPVTSPTSTATATATPSSSAPSSPQSASSNTDTSDAFSSKHVKVSSVLLAFAVALFMI